jgi:hypothetical protein
MNSSSSSVDKWPKKKQERKTAAEKERETKGEEEEEYVGHNCLA